MKSPTACPLCDGVGVAHYHRDRVRDYWHCDGCDLVFVDSADFLGAEAEKALYDLHENTIDDEGYVRFLGRTLEPLRGIVREGAKGLDFGSGPAPVLAELMRQNGFPMQVYDPFYAPDTAVLRRSHYDFITCTEVVEHFHRPAREFDTLASLLAPGGVLAVMTKRVLGPDRFRSWHYKNDPSHVMFYSAACLGYLANALQLELQIVDADVVFLLKQDARLQLH